MTVAELIAELQKQDPALTVADDEGRSVARVREGAELQMDRSEDQ